MESNIFYFQDFTHTPPEKWRYVLNHFIEDADMVEFVAVSKQATKALSTFESNLIKKFSSRLRWGKQQLNSVTYIQFALSDEIKDFLLKRPALGYWLGDLPEDPTLFSGEKVLMWTISHESLGFFNFSETEALKFRSEGFSLEKTEPLYSPPIA